MSVQWDNFFSSNSNVSEVSRYMKRKGYQQLQRNDYHAGNSTVLHSLYTPSATNRTCSYGTCAVLYFTNWW